MELGADPQPILFLWHNNIRSVFWVAVIPGVAAVALLVAGVSEPDSSSARSTRRKILWSSLREFPPGYWWLVVLGGIFTLARFSEAFLVLRGLQAGLPVGLAPVVLIVMNLIYAATAYPAGKLADSMRRPKILMLGLVTLFTADVVLALCPGRLWFLVGIASWGLHMGLTQGVLAAMVADAAPEHLRGSAFGFFNLASGVALLIASVLAGWLWDRFGAAWTFGAGAAFCIIVLLLLGVRSIAAAQK